MVDLTTLSRFFADPRPGRARVDGRLVCPDEVVSDGVRVEHVGDLEWAVARGFALHPRRDVWIGVVAVEELHDLEVHPLPSPGVVDGSAWAPWPGH